MESSEVYEGVDAHRIAKQEEAAGRRPCRTRRSRQMMAVTFVLNNTGVKP